MSLAKGGRTGWKGEGAGAILSLFELKHIMQESALETSSYQAAHTVSKDRAAFLEAVQGRDLEQLKLCQVL